MVLDSVEYDKYVSILSSYPAMLRRFHEYYIKNKRASFAEIKRGFEALWLEDIVKNPTIYREYRAYVREHCVKQGKPWPIVYNSFWKDCKHRMDPSLYRNFVVFNTIGKYKVEEFYQWLDNSSIQPKRNYSNNRVSVVIPETDVKVLEKNAYRLYHQKEMWKRLKKGQIIEDKWYNTLKATIVKLIRKQLTIIDEIRGKIAKRNYYVYEINRVLLRFHKCFHTPGFSFGEDNDAFLKVCIQKGLEFATNIGIPEGTYLLAKIRPEMFSDDCCPFMDVFKDEYYNTDVEKLLTIRVFRNLSWCHTYWSEEYHMGVPHKSNPYNNHMI